MSDEAYEKCVQRTTDYQRKIIKFPLIALVHHLYDLKNHNKIIIILPRKGDQERLQQTKFKKNEKRRKINNVHNSHVCITDITGGLKL